jgi:hypothetical protein
MARAPDGAHEAEFSPEVVVAVHPGGCLVSAV